MVHAQRTSANLHEPHQHRESKVCRVLLHSLLEGDQSATAVAAAGPPPAAEEPVNFARLDFNVMAALHKTKEERDEERRQRLEEEAREEESRKKEEERKLAKKKKKQKKRNGQNRRSCWCGSCRFAVLEPPDQVQKHPTHLASSVMVWFV